MLSFSILYYSTKSRIHRPKIKIKFLFIFICSLIFCSIRILNNNFGSGQRFLIRADPDPQHWPEKHVPYFPNLQRSSWNFNPRCYCCSPGWPGEPVEPVLRELLWPGLCTTAGQQRRATPLQVRCPNCNDVEEFTTEMKTFGIYIPEQDASWETDNQFEVRELNVRKLF